VIAAILVALTSLLGCSIAAQAHQINLTYARLVVSPDRTVEVEIAMKGSDADRVAGTEVFDDGAGLVRPAALAAASASNSRRASATRRSARRCFTRSSS
jgi:hypothetical protein